MGVCSLAAAVADKRPISASWTPAAALLRVATARVNRPRIIISAVPPMAKITNAKKMI